MSVLEILNDKQKEAAMQIEGPVLILAGAGSGKTRVLTNRTAYMIDEAGISPWNILAITFTNKAADEMRSRIDDLVGYGSESIWVATFHSTCVRILRRHIDLIGFDNNFTIYDTDDSKSVMKEVLKRLQIDTKQYPEKRFLNYISSCKDELLSYEDEEKDALGDYADELFAKVYRLYQEELRKNNALDFDDLIMKTVELFKAAPEVLENYQKRFMYIMVDEYQDTNTAQFELIRLLAAKNRNICVVGDDDQSIYKFRGANIRNILDFEKVYPDAKVVKLEQNYRSTQTILDAANAVISNNSGRKEKSLWTDRGEGNKISFLTTDTAYEEAELIVDRICRDKRAGNSSYKDNAVLYRTNAQSRLLEEKCIMAGIPYSVLGGVNFYSRKEIKDILAYLKTIDNGKDDLAVRRIINVPKRGIGATTIGKLADYGAANGLNFYDCCVRAEEILGHGKAAEKIAEFVSLIGLFKSKLGLISLEQLVDDIIDRTDYEQMLEESDPDDAAERMENIGELVNKVIAYEEQNDEPTLSGLLEEIALVADIDSVDENADKVMLMTLHSAKGLEFPNVYLAGMEDGLFPGYMSIVADDPSEIEEERRLCYVGITRAENRLTISAARSRMIRGETQYNSVSRFVKEIPDELFDSPVNGKRQAAPVSNTASFPVKVRPVAISAPKARAAAAKPFISKAVAFTDLKKGADINTLAAPDYGPGDRVSHMKFGEGTVLSVEKGTRDYEVSVDFDNAGVKKMFAAFAKLKKL
ncbi:MAG: UvrD-helicase domain-containing protein [Lachnospiraceae bacterium]|nr:UvrD-helicase domain-containing protein [Lachnospiraceae bacterium]